MLRRIAAGLVLLALQVPAAARAQQPAPPEKTAPAASLPASALPSPAPRRVASLNLCADELLLRLAGPERVVSVTFLAQDSRASNVADLARGVPVNRGLAEEIVPLAPDLVVVGAFTTRATTAMLHRLGFEVMELAAPGTLAEAYAQIRTVAARLGVPERGEAMVRQMETAFARLPPADTARPTAVVLRPNGFTTAGGSLADDLMEKAGLINLAASLSTDKMGQLALEEIVRAQPDFLVVNAEDDAPPSLAEALLRHPALAPFAAGGRTISLPLRLWTCAGPELAEAAARLAAARARLPGVPAAARPPLVHAAAEPGDGVARSSVTGNALPHAGPPARAAERVR
ncbi:ABC transporter substrate-binding protein [Xanthobacter sp. V3C-3]|uniref:ABC transporter substrate-binding protein n=1 Tax=Xanthobacter lutulentifluminis TaxID=3119935 RepID=UPI00372746FC